MRNTLPPTLRTIAKPPPQLVAVEPCWFVTEPPPGIAQILVLGVPSPSTRGIGLAEYEVLVRTNNGHVIWLQLRDRKPPDISTIMRLLNLLDNRYSDLKHRLSCEVDEHLTEQCGICVKMRNDCFDEFAKRGLSNIVARALLLDIVLQAPADRNRMRQKIADQMHTAYSAFITGIKPEALALAKMAGSLRPSVINFLVGPNEQLGIYRQQASRTLPMLLQRFCLHEDNRNQALMAAIDGGIPLFACISETWNAPRSAIKALVHVTSDWIDNDLRPDFDLFLKVLSDIDHNRRPHGRDQWLLMTKALAMISRLSRRSLLASSNRVWIGAVACRGYLVPDTEDAAATASGRLIDDFLSATELALRCELNKDSTSKNFIEDASRGSQYLASSLSIPRLVELGRRFREARRQEELALAEEIEALASGHWPSPIDGDIDAGELLVHFLRSPAELSQEGVAMRNCVASFGTNCMQGRSQIFSIRRKSGVRVSTLETDITRHPNGNYECLILQHHSASNSRPSAAAWCAATMLQNTIARGGESLDRYWLWKGEVSGKTRAVREQAAYVTPMIRALKTVLPKHLNLTHLIEHINKSGNRG